MYAPTFRDGYAISMPFSDKFYLKLNRYLKVKNQILLIKKHPVEKKIKILTGLSNIIDVSKDVDDVQELLLCVDALITDYSSTTSDFVLTNKPIMFYPYDYDSYTKNCRSIFYDYYQELPGPFVDKENGLLKLIKEIDTWFNEPAYHNRYLDFKNKFNKYQDGNSCKRLLKYLSSMN